MTVSLTAITCLVILDLQHLGKPGKKDLGATHDFDGDGLIEQGENEAELTPIYAQAAVDVLVDMGADVVVLSKGSYSSRWKKAAQLAKKVKGPVAYVACHLNKGGGDYGLVCFDDRSTGGRMLAGDMGAELHLAFSRPEIRRVVSDDLAKTSNFPRALNTIKGIWEGPANLSGVCFEPLFLDTHATMLGALTAQESDEKQRSEDAHSIYLEGHSGYPDRTKTPGELRAQERRSTTLNRVGRALAAGVARWIVNPKRK